MTALVMLGFSIAAAPAWGYVLEGPQLLDLMVAHTGPLRGLAITQRLIYADPESTDRKLEGNAKLLYRHPGAVRTEVFTEYSHQVFLFRENQALTVVDGQIQEASPASPQRYAGVILDRSAPLLQSRLARWGVDLNNTSLGRWHSIPVYVIGAQYPDESVPQLWLDKETFRPVRWLRPGISAGTASSPMEYRFLDWRQYGEAWIPQRIELHQDGHWVHDILAEHVQVNPRLDSGLFDPAKLKAAHNSRRPSAGQQQPQGRDEVRETIEEFKKLYD